MFFDDDDDDELFIIYIYIYLYVIEASKEVKANKHSLAKRSTALVPSTYTHRNSH